jgi:hypothetical protein
MSPPPTNIDGSDITGATIDGQTVDEITVDGQTVFTAFPGIPNNVTNHYPVDEGSGSTLTDNIGNLDGTINGANFQSLSNAVGGFVLDYDGIDDNDSLGSGTLDFYNGDFTITAFVKPENIGSDRYSIFHQRNGGGIRFEIRGGVGNALTLVFFGVATTESSLSVPTGVFSFVSVRYDSSANSIKFNLNGNTDTKSASNPVNANGGEALFAAGGGQEFEGQIDERTLSDSRLSDADIQTLRNRRPDI